MCVVKSNCIDKLKTSKGGNKIESNKDDFNLNLFVA